MEPEFNLTPERGEEIYVIGKSNFDLSLIESGIITDTDVNLRKNFGEEFESPTFLLMNNI